MLDSVEWAIRKYAIDRNRVYLAGNSMGGQGALAVGLPHGEVVAAIHANVPATVWLPAARMGFVGADGVPVPPAAAPSPLADPPVVLDWSGSNDHWSRNHELLWGGYAGDGTKAEMKVAEGSGPAGQINAFFRWNAVADDARGVGMDLWIESPDKLGTKQFAVPETATADVTLRRVRAQRPAPGRRYAWAFGAQKGVVAVGPDGLLTIPGLELSRERRCLVVRPL